jgi:putative transposase
MRRIPVLDRISWHVVLRGARRLQLFHDTEDFEVFLAMLKSCGAEASTDCSAYALLSNHGHLALLGSSAELTDCMRHLDRGYSGYHNKKYGLAGHTFDQAYFAQAIRNDYVLQRVARYIHLNPVRAGLSARPQDYRWSSYAALMQGVEDRFATASDVLLRCFGEKDPRRAYVAFTEADLLRPRRPRPTTKTCLELWQEQFLWVLELAEARRSDRSVDPLKAAVAAAANAGIPPRAIGLALGDDNGLRVSQILYRTRKQLALRPDWVNAVASLDIL